MIRSLLVDNYDSYTFNLFNLMTQVNGVEPVVCHNDDPALPEALDAVDCVVISPGPGDPRTPQDFGGCSQLLRRAAVPVLGVCLGHQGIGVQHGAVLDRAPAPRHGHIARIKHTGDELFHGIPQDFPAVRYHSLALTEPLPADLEALAWAEDGVLMALRHRELPLWGVQFHPESVLTQYGATLLGNFRAAVERHQGRDSVQLAAPAAARGTHRYTAHVVTIAAEPDTEALFGALFGGSDRSVWLDSAAERADTGRFSYLAQASDTLGELLTYHVGDDAVVLDAGPRGTERLSGTLFEVLEAELGRRHIDAPELPFDFTGGYVGYFGYELKGDLGAVNRHRSDLPDAVWAFVDRIAVVDRLDRTVHLLALGTDDPAAQDAARDWLESAQRTVTEVAAAGAAHPDAADAPPAGGAATVHALAEECLERDRETYLADIAAVMDKLRAGESYEVCLTNTARLPAPPDPFAYYRTLRRLNAAPYAAYLSLGAVTVACSSPERFLRVTRDRVVESKPIKGTAPRGATAAEDAAIAAELATSAKTMAENLMIVDLLRNDLSQVCVPGSVHVPALMRVESYATVHQLVSTVRGLLREGTTAVSCARSCFPGGSMTGAPKRRTMEIIDELETSARGVYSGAIGFLACNGTADLNIAIRTAVFADGQMRVGAGGAIVLDSDPVEEFEEILLKAAATLRAHPAGSPQPVGEPA